MKGFEFTALLIVWADSAAFCDSFGVSYLVTTLSVTMEQARRSAVLELHRAGHSKANIVRLLKYPKSTVYAVVKRYKETREDNRKSHKPRLDKIHSPRFVAGLKRSIDANPGKSQTELVRTRNVSTRTVRRAINKDLEYKSFRLRVRHLLTDAHREQREIRGKVLISSLKSTGGHLRFFSDEKLFNVDCTHNKQNTRWICQDPEDVPMVFKTKNLASVMVLGVISSDRHVMRPHFLAVGLRINKKVYKAILEDVVVPWMKGVAGRRPFTFQQDSAPAHKSQLVQSWLLGAVPHFWPASV